MRGAFCYVNMPIYYTLYLSYIYALLKSLFIKKDLKGKQQNVNSGYFWVAGI